MNVPIEGDLFTPKSETLDSLLPDIHKHKIALPNFQRAWIWEPEMVRDLLVSVAYRYPAGSLLTMPINKTGFALRPFEGSGDTLKASPTHMILDGQQRLTSLYQSLFQPDGVKRQGRTHHFYLDIPVLLSLTSESSNGVQPFEVALFFITEDRRSGRKMRYEGLKPRYELDNFEQEVEAGAFPLHLVYNNDGLARWKERYLLKLTNGTNDLQHFMALNNQWEKLILPWLQRLRTYRFPVVELNEQMPLGAICHIFEKVNSTGVPLDVFDLCNAILWAQGFELNKRWGVTQLQLKDKLPMQPLSGTQFLQGLSLLDSLNRKRAEQDREISINCRKQDLMVMNRQTVEKWWPILVDGYKEAAKFMVEHGILAQRILPYTTLIVPLSAIFADILQRKGSLHVGAAWPKINRWYWCSVFSQRYSSQVETASAKDFEQVLNWIDGGDTPDVVKTFVFRSDYLQEITSIRNAIYKGILCLLAQNHARDFGGGGTLSTALFFDTSQDHHHIFPTDSLKTLKISDPRSDTIVNKTLISSSVNRSIGGRLPSLYVNEWRTKLGDDLFDEILKSHKVDPDILASNNWERYVNDRREGLRNLISSVCGGIVQPFSDMNELEVERDDDLREG